MCWDNFDINEETPSGAGTTHTTHGIVIQEVYTYQHVPMSVDSLPRTRERSLLYTPSNLQHCFSKKLVEPSLSVTHCYDITSISDKLSHIYFLPADTLWIICRGLFNDKWTASAWSGWVSKTGELKYDTIQSKFGYLAPILHPITDYSTVQQCIVASMKITSKLQQDYTFITMDFSSQNRDGHRV